MENKDKNIFRPPTKMMIPESIRIRVVIVLIMKIFLTNDCRNLYGQVMFTIKRVGLQQYVKKCNGTLRMAE